MKIRVGSRDSRLAVLQSEIVLRGIAAAAPAAELELVTMKTTGDRILHKPLDEIGGKGLFVKELDQALRDGRVDFTVHSLKDLPSAPCPGLVVAATLKREDPRDALVARDGLTVDTLPEGSRVGTGSPRRAAQLRALRPDLEIVDIRGNVGTRIGRVKGLEEHAGKQVVLRQNTETSERADHGVGTERSGDCDAVVLAVSGLKYLVPFPCKEIMHELSHPALVIYHQYLYFVHSVASCLSSSAFSLSSTAFSLFSSSFCQFSYLSISSFS